MSLLHERESAQIAQLATILPAHKVMASAGSPDAILPHLTCAGPTAILRIVAWDAAENAIDWAVLLIDDTAAPPEVRRVGEGAGGLLQAIDQLRAGVSETDGCASSGGSIVRVDAAVLAWEERLREFLPESPAAPSGRPPAFATELSDSIAVISGASAEDTHFDELDAFPAGARILASHAAFGICDLGITIETEPEHHELVTPLEQPVPAGTKIASAGGLIVHPRGTRVTQREHIADWRPATTRLDGRFAAGLIAPRSSIRQFAFHATTRAFTEALSSLVGQLESQAQVLYLDGAGDVFMALPTAFSLPSTIGDAPTLEVRTIRATTLDALVEGF